MEIFDTIESIKDIPEFDGVDDYLKDELVTEALNRVLRLLKKPDVQPGKLGMAITELQSLSAAFQVKANFYKVLSTGRAGSEEFKRKNLYYALSDALDKVVAALKYLSKD